ncbi:homoserine dehydrogenase [Patescibacteria group bacterium]|nr:homoserine dehydrogenase [Patescibacteria group bacterium]
MSLENKKPINVGLIGMGNIGTGVVRYFQDGRGEPFNIHLKRVAVRDLSKPRAVQFSSITDNPTDILRDPSIDIIVELMGGIDLARKFTLDAIDNGKSVVNGNKAYLARHMRELFEAARQRQVSLGFEASVGGGIQIINIFHRQRGETMTGFSGILNGTGNYILTKMERKDFAKALKEAQEKGYAESDPRDDIEGYDTRNKLAVLASLAFNTQIDVSHIPCTGITGVSKIDIDFANKYGVDEGKPGYAVKLLGIAKRHGTHGVELRVQPVMVSRDNLLAAVRNSYNAIRTEPELAGAQIHYGKGAGESPTTSAVVSDIIQVAENIRKGVQDEYPALDGKVTYVNPDRIKQRGYVRVNLKHKPGSGAETLRILADHGLNVEDSIQRRRFRTRENGVIYIPDIITFEAAPQGDIDAALEEIKKSDRVYGTPFFMSIAA